MIKIFRTDYEFKDKVYISNKLSESETECPRQQILHCCCFSVAERTKLNPAQTWLLAPTAEALPSTSTTTCTSHSSIVTSVLLVGCYSDLLFVTCSWDTKVMLMGFLSERRHQSTKHNQLKSVFFNINQTPFMSKGFSNIFYWFYKF